MSAEKALEGIAGLVREVAGQRYVERTLHDLVRATDRAARHGPDEFAVILPEADSAGVARVAETIRLQVEATEDARLRSTVSIGAVSVSPEAFSADALVHDLKVALFSAQRRGRNRVFSVDRTGTD